MNIVVTGATKGIGRSIVEIFAREGFDLAICSRSEGDLNNLKEYIETKYQVNVLARPTDVSVKSEVLNFSKLILDNWDSVDVLVNNAGIFIPGLVHEEEDGVLEKMINTNLYSAYYLSRALIPKMKAQKSGHIFNISSVAGMKAYENGGSYGISKFAMRGMNMSFREELKEYNIRVTAIMPGATLTASWEGVDLPEDRFIPAEDVGQLVWDAYKLSKRSVVEDIVIRPQLGDL